MLQKRNFTLIELIVVLAVLGLLASLVIPNISGMQEKALVAQTVSNIRNIQTAVDMYYVEHENYPCVIQPTEDSLKLIDYDLLNINYLREQPSGNYTYAVDFNGTVSVANEDLEQEPTETPSTPPKLEPPIITSNIDPFQKKVYTDTVLSFSYDLEDSNIVVLAEKWTVDGEERDTAPKQTFKEGKHLITLSLEYSSKTKSVQTYLTEEVTFEFNVFKPIVIKQISAGWYHSLALTEDGQVYAWGNNQYGQLGDGTNTHRLTPTLVTSLPNIKKVETGTNNSLALTENGQVYVWGENTYGQLGDGTNVDKSIPTRIISLYNVEQISAGGYHCFALTKSGQVYSWGLNSSGQLGNGTTVTKNTPTLVTSLSNVQQISAGYYFTIALTKNGQVYAWGHNAYGQLGDGTLVNKSIPTLLTSLSNIQQISAGGYHTLALTSSGQVYAWGYNHYGQLGDNTVVDRTKPNRITSLSNIKQVVAGKFSNSLALTNSGKVYAWGCNSYGELGNGTTTNKSNPTPISSLSNVQQISAGSHHTVALTENAEVYDWGHNISGQLGNGTTTDKSTPTNISTSFK